MFPREVRALRRAWYSVCSWCSTSSTSSDRACPGQKVESSLNQPFMIASHPLGGCAVFDDAFPSCDAFCVPPVSPLATKPGRLCSSWSSAFSMEYSAMLSEGIAGMCVWHATRSSLGLRFRPRGPLGPHGALLPPEE
jgi:hypothetical protein